MSVRVWDTRGARDAEFDAAWAQRLRNAPLAHFALELELLAWNARHGEHGRAVLLDEGDRRAALVLRETRDGWISGWPWRWQAAFEGSGRDTPPGFGEDEARWLFDRAQAVAGARRLRMHLPFAPPGRRPGYFAGNTLFHDIRHDDDALLKAMDTNKRRTVKRAQQRGYQAVVATTPEHYRGFAEIQRLTDERHGETPTDALLDDPAPGEQWREWEHPWMWLIVAVRDGRVESGHGYGVRLGGLLDSRTGASTEAGRKDGAFSLCVYEGARLGRDRGHAYVNQGGDTVFKREMLGKLAQRVTVWTWLGGGALWSVPNALDAGLRHARSRLATAVRSRGGHVPAGAGPAAPTPASAGANAAPGAARPPRPRKGAPA